MSKLITLSKLKTALTPLIALINKKAERPNWNEKDSESVSYIENRPFYTDEEEVTCYEGSVIVYDYLWNETQYDPINFQVQDGMAYKVTIDETEYEVTGKTDEYNDTYIGSDSLWMNIGNWTDAEVPFAYGNGWFAYCIEGTYNVKIIAVQETITKIPEKYLPELTLIGAKGTGENAEIFNGTENKIASGEYSHAEGSATTASGNSAHAEGMASQAIGFVSHAEGGSTTASGNYAHSEGFATVASGELTHAEGYRSVASGKYSHAEGWHTIAQRQSQHTQGEFNVLDTIGGTLTRGKYVHIVGNGTSDSARSNAHTLDWNGKAWFAGDVYVGGTGQDDTNAKKLITEESVNSVVTTKIEPLESSIDTLNTNVESHETRISSIETYISSPRKGIPMLDEVNGYTYILTMRNGELVTYIGTDYIEVTQMPNKMTYMEGEYLDTDGMIVMAYGQDGSSKEITNIIELSSVSSNGDVEITYTECGYVFTTIINVESTSFDPVTTLIDFEYTDNGDGTYTITDWKGTTNGAASTEIIIPNNSKIIV